MTTADDILFEPIKKSDVLKAVCASCHKIFEKPSISGEIYCQECRHQTMSGCAAGEAVKDTSCPAGDGCCGGGCC